MNRHANLHASIFNIRGEYMKRYIANRALYLIFPFFVLAVIVSYVFVLYKKSYTYVNYINIGFDVILLYFYLSRFCTEISMDSKGINFKGLFFKKRVYNEDFIGLKQSDFLTKIITKSGSYYILTTNNGRKLIKDMFKDAIKRE